MILQEKDNYDDFTTCEGCGLILNEGICPQCPEWRSRAEAAEAVKDVDISEQ